MDRAEALDVLPHTYAIALRLRDEGIEPEVMARVLDVEPEAVGPLLALAESKLAGLMEHAVRKVDQCQHSWRRPAPDVGHGAPRADL